MPADDEHRRLEEAVLRLEAQAADRRGAIGEPVAPHDAEWEAFLASHTELEEVDDARR